MKKTRLERIAEKKIRVCRSMHHCDLCNKDILNGQKYHDGGYGMRAHVDCVVLMRIQTGV